MKEDAKLGIYQSAKNEENNSIAIYTEIIENHSMNALNLIQKYTSQIKKNNELLNKIINNQFKQTMKVLLPQKIIDKTTIEHKLNDESLQDEKELNLSLTPFKNLLNKYNKEKYLISQIDNFLCLPKIIQELFNLPPKLIIYEHSFIIYPNCTTKQLNNIREYIKKHNGYINYEKLNSKEKY